MHKLYVQQDLNEIHCKLTYGSLQLGVFFFQVGKKLLSMADPRRGSKIFYDTS